MEEEGKHMNAQEETFEISKVQCDICNHIWIAVRPEGLVKLECPHCGIIGFFENVDFDG